MYLSPNTTYRIVKEQTTREGQIKSTRFIIEGQLDKDGRWFFVDSLEEETFMILSKIIKELK